MANYSVAQAQAALAELLDRASGGERVAILQKDGMIIDLTLRRDEPEHRRLWLDWLAARRHPPIGVTSLQLLDELEEENR